MNPLQAILAAIEQNENVAASEFNPGGIQYGPYAISQGAVSASPGGNAVFPDYSTGYNAAANLLQAYGGQGTTLGQLVAKWTGQNGSSAYNNSVIAAGGGNPNSLLSDLFGAAGSGTSTGSGSALPSLPSLSAGGSTANPGSSWLTRGVAIAAGLVMVAAGLFLFKPTQSVVVNATKAVKGTAEAATAVAT